MARELPAGVDLDLWYEMVDRAYRSHVRLVVGPGSQTELKEQLANSDAFKIRGMAGSGCVAIF